MLLLDASVQKSSARLLLLLETLHKLMNRYSENTNIIKDAKGSLCIAGYSEYFKEKLNYLSFSWLTTLEQQIHYYH